MNLLILPELQGVWATGKTLEECRKNLEEVIDEWIIIRLRKGLTIPPIGNSHIETTGEMAVACQIIKALPQQQVLFRN